jgi:hypothetical protein
VCEMSMVVPFRGGQWHRQKHFSLVTLIPVRNNQKAKNLLSVSTTIPIRQCRQCQLAYIWIWKLSKNSIYKEKVHST